MSASSLKAWIHAFRLRTLPLALASIGMGISMAYANHGFRLKVSILAVLTTLFLQILSNLANDFGDSKKGVDNADRLGPERAMQQGIISPAAMKTGILIFVLLALSSGIWLLIEAFKGYHLPYTAILFFIVGIISIAASILYTVGKNPYGYHGLGDFFVFLFFGLVAVIGTYFLNTLHIGYYSPWPAIAIGFLSTGVLNLNNMRDVENDTRFNKKTIVVKIGSRYALLYHSILILGALILMLAYTILTALSYWEFLFLLSYPLFIKDWIQILRTKHPSALDNQLKKLAINTLLLVLFYGAGVIIAGL
ncbi:MAG: 1,4-dihydroxy-2-naphthoate octaprenyltransferase [Bacteroidales bacterium]|nr:1,4-dihydroxy-2-naphthoate octaprenyltransferase [Bacteroidales bacterium]